MCRNKPAHSSFAVVKFKNISYENKCSNDKKNGKF